MGHRKEQLKIKINQALGKEPADLVIKSTQFLNVVTGEIASGDIAICGDKIIGTYEEYEGRKEIDGSALTVVPGFIDSHVHIESSMITPLEFERCVLSRGTTTAICDPHEISNVLGEEGLKYFLDQSTRMQMTLKVQLSSCVPATHLETSGAQLTAKQLEKFKYHPSVIGLAEMMNYPGIFTHDDEVLDKLVLFEGEHIDGHCPLVSGYELNAYCSAGIKNCHESTSFGEAQEKLRKGMQVLMREGSVSKDIDALIPLLNSYNSPFLTLCTDDRNPLDIEEEGHMDYLIRLAISKGAEIPQIYRSASWSAAKGFGLTDRGLVAPGYRADLALLESLESCSVAEVIAGGQVVSDMKLSYQQPKEKVGYNSVKLSNVAEDQFKIVSNQTKIPVIGIIPNSIITNYLEEEITPQQGELISDVTKDLLKIFVFERHGRNKAIGKGFVKGFQLKSGAIASTVGHDSHNLIVVGCDDQSMKTAVNHLIKTQGGFVVTSGNDVLADLALPVAGLMSDLPFEEVCTSLKKLKKSAKSIGCSLTEPFLQLAFLPLPVIPHLKITDQGLVDVDKFEFVSF